MEVINHAMPDESTFKLVKELYHSKYSMQALLDQLMYNTQNWRVYINSKRGDVMDKLLLTQILANILGILVFATGVVFNIYHDVPTDIRTTIDRKPVDLLLLTFESGLLFVFIVLPLALIVAPWIWPQTMMPIR